MRNMNRLFSISCLTLLLSAIPAHAQILRRPLVRQFIQSPFVHDVVNFGIHQFLPGFPSLPNITLDNSARDSSPILVDASVKGNLDRSAKNLQDANAIMTGLMDKNKAYLDQQAVPIKDSAGPPKDNASTPMKDGKPADAVAPIQLHIERGHQALLKERFADAADAFRAALKVDAGDANARQGLAYALSELRNQDLANAIKALTTELRNSNKATTNLAEVKINPIKEVVDVSKKGNTVITVELANAAPQDLTLKASAKGVDAGILTGSGAIKKGETKGAVTITTNNVLDTLSELTIEVGATSETKAATMTIKIKVKAN
jgi:hypothetical protein